MECWTKSNEFVCFELLVAHDSAKDKLAISVYNQKNEVSHYDFDLSKF